MWPSSPGCGVLARRPRRLSASRLTCVQEAAAQDVTAPGPALSWGFLTCRRPIVVTLRVRVCGAIRRAPKLVGQHGAPPSRTPYVWSAVSPEGAHNQPPARVMLPGAEKAGSEAVWGVACLVELWGRWGRDTHNLGRTSGQSFLMREKQESGGRSGVTACGRETWLLSDWQARSLPLCV